MGQELSCDQPVGDLLKGADTVTLQMGPAPVWPDTSCEWAVRIVTAAPDVTRAKEMDRAVGGVFPAEIMWLLAEWLDTTGIGPSAPLAAHRSTRTPPA
jgi:hypothetical protein